MNEKYYTVEQISEMLNMHQKTIQRYIREGKLKATKIGKSWRVTGHDLSVFAEGTKNIDKKIPGDDTNCQSAGEKVKISSVIDINVEDMEEAIQIVNTLTALLNTKPSENCKSTMSAQFLEPENKVRIMIWGNIELAEIMISSISALIKNTD